MKTRSICLKTFQGILPLVLVLQTPPFVIEPVGFLNLPIQPNLQLIANQLRNDPDSVEHLFAAPPDGTLIYKFTGAGFSTNAFLADGGWDNPEQTLEPGEGAFIQIPTNAVFTVTFVGEVLQGDLTNAI